MTGTVNKLRRAFVTATICGGLTACQSPDKQALDNTGTITQSNQSSELGSPWHLMLSHDREGQLLEGSVAQVVNAVRSGCQHRIAWGGAGRRTVEHVADVKWITVYNDNELKAQIGDFLFNLEFLGDDFPRAEPFGGTDEVVHWRATLKPDGSFNAIWYKPHSGELVTRRPQNHPMKWYADCDPGITEPLYIRPNEQARTQGSSRSESKTLAELSEAEVSALKAEVSEFATSYFKAMEDLDEDAILSHVIKSPNFAYTRRGSRSNYEEFEAGTKGLVTRFTDKISTMGPMTVDLIEPDVAVMSYTFEQTLTDTDGKKRDFSGTVTWIAVKRDGEWRYIHGLSY